MKYLSQVQCTAGTVLSIFLKKTYMFSRALAPAGSYYTLDYTYM